MSPGKIEFICEKYIFLMITVLEDFANCTTLQKSIWDYFIIFSTVESLH